MSKIIMNCDIVVELFLFEDVHTIILIAIALQL